MLEEEGCALPERAKAKGIRTVRIQSFDGHYLAPFLERRPSRKFREWIDGGCHLFVAEHRGKPVGYLCVQVGSSTPDSLNRFFGLGQEDGFVLDVYMTQQRRGQGYYMQLVGESVQVLRSEGCKYVWATFDGKNRAAISSASRVGFRTLGYCVRWQLGQRRGYWLITKSGRRWWRLKRGPLPSMIPCLMKARPMRPAQFLRASPSPGQDPSAQRR